MEYKQSLSRRIVIAFVLMTALVGGTFSFGIVETVHLVEERLISSELGGDLDRLLKMESVDEWRHRPEPSLLFHYTNGPGEFALSEGLQDLPPGFSEMFRDNQSYYAYVHLVDGRRYVLLKDQSEFEEREQLLFGVVLVGFLLSLALSGLLGRVLARKVIEPVVRLSSQVRHPDQLLDAAPQLAPDYAADEVGQLAVSFDTTLGLLRRALVRERLFTSDVSHELRTPLMVLASSTELLLESSTLDARSRAQVQRIARACEEMRELVQTFLLLARSSSNSSMVAPIGGLRGVADSLVEQWRPQIEAKGLTFDYHPEFAGADIYNSPLLRSVMGNLLRNAWHYTEQGRVMLSLGATGFVVEDSGVGIPQAEREAMFQPFVRGGAARGEGLGLGLSLVQRICESQGWRVVLSDARPRGCRFEVSLQPFTQG